jgi:hypothetical protein
MLRTFKKRRYSMAIFRIRLAFQMPEVCENVADLRHPDITESIDFTPIDITGLKKKADALMATAVNHLGHSNQPLDQKFNLNYRSGRSLPAPDGGTYKTTRDRCQPKLFLIFEMNFSDIHEARNWAYSTEQKIMNCWQASATELNGAEASPGIIEIEEIKSEKQAETEEADQNTV